MAMIRDADSWAPHSNDRHDADCGSSHQSFDWNATCSHDQLNALNTYELNGLRRMIEKELLLTARKNLPEHLRVLADKYPATSW